MIDEEWIPIQSMVFCTQYTQHSSGAHLASSYKYCRPCLENRSIRKAITFTLIHKSRNPIGVVWTIAPRFFQRLSSGNRITLYETKNNVLSGRKNELSIQRESRWAPTDLEKTKFSCVCPDSNPDLRHPAKWITLFPLHHKTIKNIMKK